MYAHSNGGCFLPSFSPLFPFPAILYPLFFLFPLFFSPSFSPFFSPFPLFCEKISPLLAQKLEYIVLVRGTALQWLSSYLSSRHQTVRVSASLSDPLPVVSGVPQGSILGPLLFLTYVNDLPSLDPDVSLFADDTALLCSDSSPSNLVTPMQTDINTTIAWMEAWKLRPNIAKTEAMFISPSPPTQPLHFPGANANVKIVHEHKHLGVIFDSHMSWSPQVQSVCKRASSSLGMLQPHCHHLNVRCRKLFFSSYILPIFDYCDTAWCGLSQCSNSGNTPASASKNPVSQKSNIKGSLEVRSTDSGKGYNYVSAPVSVCECVREFESDRESMCLCGHCMITRRVANMTFKS